MNSEHIDTETLSAYADHELKAVALARVEQHLATCAECAKALARLRAVITAAGALPRDIAPPPETWQGIRNRVPGSQSPVPRRWWHNGWLASAAAVVLVVGTALLTTRGGGKAKGARLPDVQATAAATPIIVASVQRHYEPTITQLREAFDAQRSTLAPATVRALDHSLAVIDTAIAEARNALAADPASFALRDMLSGYYERKVEFLKRATALSSSL